MTQPNPRLLAEVGFFTLDAMNFAPTSAAILGYRAGTWKADPVHSEVAFSVRHLVISKTSGRFRSFDVTIVTSEDPVDSSVTATIELASIDTGDKTRDDHLRAADFLDVERYPTMSYRSTGIRQADGGWIVDGELTLHGVTRQVPLLGERLGSALTRSAGSGPASRRRRTARHDFGIDTSMPRDGGGVVVGDNVAISLEIEACSRADLPPAAASPHLPLTPSP